ncbi:unknown [Anaerotruncus sp. CAG:390]|nr:unknown [Anaerotruncus sp. CAG:390]
MYAAARNYHDVTALSDVKIIVHHIVKSGLAEYHGNVHTLVDRAGLDINVDAGFVLFCLNVDVCGRVAPAELSVFAYIVCAHGKGIEIRHFMQQLFFDRVH